ncbi:Vacuolar protein sorting-associated protein 52 [Wickerhamiella sorbophila]|uniref:Vacuolar protein sorting-associated protein 52 n=1 Tax=Wickerhamiella sorbophila TaxID=45607 RepID=A0A2T0FLQ1_9ASCO|nr:Vacuolar protein sorting-associated protein 52 [Wickerhamiella sorbophila]PRT55923.1 Vacuolar protein sorting-associated protein 52 [Wickerhamiella sorbophila]
MQSEVSRLLGIEPEQLAAAAERARDKSHYKTTSEKIDLASFSEWSASVEDFAKLVDSTLKDLELVEQQSEKFKSDISQLSSEMSQLQALSSNLHHRLEVRKEVELELSPICAERVVPPAVVSEISTGEIGPQWRAALALLLKRPMLSTSSADTSESQRFIDTLLTKATARIKVWYVYCVRRIRQPGTNAETVQGEIINNKPLYEFLLQREPRLARRLHLAYCNTVRWYYTMLFGKYNRNIDRMPVILVDSSKTLGALGASAHKSIFVSKSTARGTDVFNIGSRPTILTSNDTAICLGQTSPPQGYHIEIILRSLLLVLYNSMKVEQETQREGFANVAASANIADLSIRENAADESVAVEELALDSEVNSDMSELPVDSALFTKPLAGIQATFTRLSHENFDIYGLILSLRLIQQMPKDVADFNVFAKVLESLLWTEITFVLDANLKSIEQAASKSSSHRAASDVTPHPMTQLFAQFLTGILQISTENEALDEPLAPKLRQMTSGFEMFVTKLSKASSDAELFLYNNYFLISALLSDVPGKLAGELAQHLRLLTEAYAPK